MKYDMHGAFYDRRHRSAFTLSPRERQVYDLWSRDGLTPAQIAERIDATPKAVRSALRLAREKIEAMAGETA